MKVSPIIWKLDLSCRTLRKSTLSSVVVTYEVTPTRVEGYVQYGLSDIIEKYHFGVPNIFAFYWESTLN